MPEASLLLLVRLSSPAVLVLFSPIGRGLSLVQGLWRALTLGLLHLGCKETVFRSGPGPGAPQLQGYLVGFGPSP